MLRFQLEEGAFQIQLHDQQAPHTCRYFATVIKSGGLRGGGIFRVTNDLNDDFASDCPIHVVQVGAVGGLEEPRISIPHESTDVTGLRHQKWTVSASRFGPGEVYASFFICMRDEPELNHGGGRQPDLLGYAAFGEVIDGFGCLSDVYQRAGDQDLLTPPIALLSAEVVQGVAQP